MHDIASYKVENKRCYKISFPKIDDYETSFLKVLSELSFYSIELFDIFGRIEKLGYKRAKQAGLIPQSLCRK